ncbi:hypothetical protein FXV83_03385 [Bradyrhizobium hipponense]|uniref:Uncharacterized protein n=1 Tax=Bradyrhizobium hipponense TaxID=2605638 RepID=A0A5S4YTX4_9BRAD|nr:hypothetical protein [Bradyrhizobium hipponense]TYO67826.1 hypothetical protein FXV83_03385 [Bradyrhizobium hipponense]
MLERYEKLFRMALTGEVDMDKVASSYTAKFVAASPAGVSVGQNDEHLKQMMQQGFENYRRIGTKDMRLRNVRIAPKLAPGVANGGEIPPHPAKS